ncbi:aspartic proteinase-like protein 1 isoform X1 [Mangifera indica]|uniref:aspartic proteinase-like protein 1 isoform X1 n=1 Tax=Mangifera indica TaxID=29780 RepID=UPI001CF9981B|nr:aspartic proteinase-like protein 1 isoform X1 [Mangifera indica]
MANRLVMLLVSLLSYLLFDGSAAVTFSSKLIHRFSDEAKERWISRGGNASVAGMWPKKESVEFMDLLLLNDLKRQKMRVDLQSSNKSQYQLLFPSQGSHTLYFGNQFYWLHYTWIDIGTPNVSFLVALDAGSNILWVPCQCIECAPLSASNYTSLERDLSEFDPTISSSSKNLSCGDQLCKPHSNCKSLKDPCPYIAQYASQDTTSSGYLVEDVLHLASVSNYASKSSVQASVIIGCGRKQTGSYLDGAAPDGLMGLGLGDISVPTLLAKAGFIPNSFSICFDENDSGRIFFGDQGPASQQSTPFLPIGEKYDTYFVEVESYCVGSSCLQQSGFKALVDSGSSFTFLPTNVYDNVISKFDKLVTAKKIYLQGNSWKNCYNASSKELRSIPNMRLIFTANQSFVVHNHKYIFPENQGFTVFCLTVMPADGDFGIIGQNFMMGHRMVFDRENFKLGWSLSNCEDVSDRTHVHLVPPPDGGSPTPLPTNEQQSTSNASTVSPATGKRGSSKSSALSILQLHSLFLQMSLLILLICLFQPSD